MENVCPQRLKTLKRVSGSLALKKMIPVKPPRRLFYNLVRFSKIDELPKIDYKKSTRSIHTMLQMGNSKDTMRQSKRCILKDDWKRSSRQLLPNSQRKVVFNCQKIVRQSN